MGAVQNPLDRSGGTSLLVGSRGRLDFSHNFTGAIPGEECDGAGGGGAGPGGGSGGSWSWRSIRRRNDGFPAVQAGAGAACSASGRASAHGCVCSWCVRHVDVCVDALAALAVPLGVRLRMGVQQHVLLSLTN